MTFLLLCLISWKVQGEKCPMGPWIESHMPKCLNFLSAVLFPRTVNALLYFWYKTPERELFFGKRWKDFSPGMFPSRSLPAAAGALQSSGIRNYTNVSENRPPNPRPYCIDTDYQGYGAYFTVEQYSSKRSPVYLLNFQELAHAIHKMTRISWEFHPLSLPQKHFSQELIAASHSVPLS